MVAIMLMLIMHSRTIFSQLGCFVWVSLLFVVWSQNQPMNYFGVIFTHISSFL